MLYSFLRFHYLIIKHMGHIYGILLHLKGQFTVPQNNHILLRRESKRTGVIVVFMKITILFQRRLQSCSEDDLPLSLAGQTAIIFPSIACSE